MLCKPFIIYLNRMSQDLHMMLFALSDDHTQIKHFLIIKLSKGFINYYSLHLVDISKASSSNA